jgi:5-hydroxyisourate hydrolase
MNGITTHILDTARGRPAAGVGVTLERFDGTDGWQSVGQADTDRDGRIRAWTPDSRPLQSGLFRLTFNTGRYFEANGVSAFYPVVIIVFHVDAGEAHYHVPLLLNPFGYTTYRGS